MSTARQKELIEEFLAQLPPLPGGCARQTQPVVVHAKHTLKRDQRAHLASSSVLPSLTAVYLADDCRSFEPRALLLDYKGWILTEQELQRFGYAVHTAVRLPRFTAGSPACAATPWVLLGDPTMPATQVNCVLGTGKKPNAQLVLNSSHFKIGSATNSVEQQAHRQPACEDAGDQGPLYVTDSYITVRATKKIRPGTELWIDYGRDYWEHMSLYCPHCLEYGADANDQMLICDWPGCKRAWHQLCWQPSPLIDVPDGAWHCDIHRAKELSQ